MLIDEKDRLSLRVRLDVPFHLAKQRLVETFEREYLINALRKAKNNVSAASREIGVSRKHILALMQKHEIRAKVEPNKLAMGSYHIVE